MKAFRISGHDRVTGKYMVANVQGVDAQQAMQLMGLTHHRLVCLDKVGVAVCSK